MSRDRWLSGVLEALLTTMDRGAGVGGVLYELSGTDQLRTEALDTINAPPGWKEVGLEMHQSPQALPFIIRQYSSELCTTLHDLRTDEARGGELIGGISDSHGVGGQLIINGMDCSGRGCALYVFSRGAITLRDAQRDLFSRLATHIATGYRLQRQLAGGGGGIDPGVEAVLTPAGDVDHAEAAAKDLAVRRLLKLAVR